MTHDSEVTAAGNSCAGFENGPARREKEACFAPRDDRLFSQAEKRASSYRNFRFMTETVPFLTLLSHSLRLLTS